MNNDTRDFETTKLAYALTYHRYLLGKGTAKNLFTELSVAEYITLHIIKRTSSENTTLQDKIYLKDLAEKLGISIHKASKMVRELKNRGLVSWSHDGDGENGTYIIENDAGVAAMRRQDVLLEKYYKRVIEKFGQNNLVDLLEKMERLEEIMHIELLEEGVDNDD